LTASGPARALARKPQKIFDFLDFIDDSKTAVIVLQVDCLPSEKVAELIASECHVLPKDLFIVITPGKSVAGATQIAARAIEDVTFTMWEVLHYDVRKVRHMFGMAPIVPVHESTGKAVALPDDFIGYGGRVFVIVEPDEENLDELARNLVFESTPIYGRTFSEILSETNFNFKKVPGYPHIFCPAQVIINDAKTGKISKAGNLNPGMIKKCLGFNNSYCTQ
jgi:methenyltetrahydromethanopterin cyclohydrolase